MIVLTTVIYLTILFLCVLMWYTTNMGRHEVTDRIMLLSLGLVVLEIVLLVAQ